VVVTGDDVLLKFFCLLINYCFRAVILSNVGLVQLLILSFTYVKPTLKFFILILYTHVISYLKALLRQRYRISPNPSIV